MNVGLIFNLLVKRRFCVAHGPADGSLDRLMLPDDLSVASVVHSAAATDEPHPDPSGDRAILERVLDAIRWYPVCNQEIDVAAWTARIEDGLIVVDKRGVAYDPPGEIHLLFCHLDGHGQGHVHAEECAVVVAPRADVLGHALGVRAVRRERGVDPIASATNSRHPADGEGQR